MPGTWLCRLQAPTPRSLPTVVPNTKTKGGNIEAMATTITVCRAIVWWRMNVCVTIEQMCTTMSVLGRQQEKGFVPLLQRLRD